jgi:hypothetical protein
MLEHIEADLADGRVSAAEKWRLRQRAEIGARTTARRYPAVPVELNHQRQRRRTATPPQRAPKADAAKSTRAGFRPGEKCCRYSSIPA